jgi:hypothetical protein
VHGQAPQAAEQARPVGGQDGVDGIEASGGRPRHQLGHQGRAQPSTLPRILDQHAELAVSEGGDADHEPVVGRHHGLGITADPEGGGREAPHLTVEARPARPLAAPIPHALDLEAVGRRQPADGHALLSPLLHATYSTTSPL